MRLAGLVTLAMPWVFFYAAGHIENGASLAVFRVNTCFLCCFMVGFASKCRPNGLLIAFCLGFGTEAMEWPYLWALFLTASGLLSFWLNPKHPKGLIVLAGSVLVLRGLFDLMNLKLLRLYRQDPVVKEAYEALFLDLSVCLFVASADLLAFWASTPRPCGPTSHPEPKSCCSKRGRTEAPMAFAFMDIRRFLNTQYQGARPRSDYNVDVGGSHRLPFCLADVS